MKKIVKGVLYDTDTSTQLYQEELTGRSLWKTQDGNFFMVYKNGEIVPKSEDSTKAYLGEKDVDLYIEIFGNPEPEVTFESLVESTIEELNNKCSETISNGVDVELSDGVEHFSLDYQDQINLMALSEKVRAGYDKIEWHPDDQTKPCKYYSNEDMSKIIETAMMFISYNVTYFRDLRIYIRTFAKESDLKNVYYGMAIPEEYKSEVLKNYESLM